MEKNNDNPVFINANESSVGKDVVFNQDTEPFLTEVAEPFPVEQTTENEPEEAPSQETTKTTEKAEKAKNPNKHLTNLKRATLAFIGLLAIKGGSEVARDVKEAKDFIQESGYTAGEFFESAWKDILYFDEEANTIVMDSPATIKELSQNNFADISEKNQAEVEEYIEDLNKDNPQVYTNSQGEIGPGSQIKVPSHIEERSPLKTLMNYAFASEENTKEIEQSPNKKVNPDKTPETQAPEEAEPITYTIQPGDSLWDISNKMLGESGINYDPSTVMDVIAFLKESNNIEDDAIVAGKTLNIPSLEEIQKFEKTTTAE